MTGAPSAILAIVVGLVLALYSHRLLFRKFTASALGEKDAKLGLYALRATLYLLVVGLIVLIMGFVGLLGWIP